VALNEINIYARDVLYQLMGENIEVNLYKVFKKATRSWAWCLRMWQFFVMRNFYDLPLF
jgi:hypothetical protein